jgi:hypothetical protein
MAFDDDEAALIARVRDAFAENVKSLSEATRTRRNIAVKVNSYLGYNENGGGLPARVVSPGKEITGIRRRYLEALRTNLVARERYQLAMSKKHQQDLSSQANIPQADVVLTNLELALLEKQYQKLDIRRRHASTLSQDTSTLCNLELPLEQRTIRNVAEVPKEGITSSEVEVKALIAKLRKATLQANHQLDKQKALLARTNQTQARTNAGNNESRKRAQAIAAPRNVLVAWLDEKLSAGGVEQVEEFDQHGQPHDRATPSGSVLSHYQSYLVAREEVIEAGNEGLWPLPVPQTTGFDNAVLPTEEEALGSEDLFLVHAIRQRLVPLLQHRSDIMTLQKYSSALVAKEHWTTLEILERLAEESHLLSTHPLGEIEGKNQIAHSIAAWISAAKASSISMAKVAEQHHVDGLLAVEKAETELAALKKYQNTHEAFSKKNDGIN